MDLLSTVVVWVLPVFYGSQLVIIVGLFSWLVYQDAVRPRLIPAGEIERVADEIIAGHAEPEREACLREENDWYGCAFGSGVYWRRVRRAIARRKGQGRPRRTG